MSPYVDQKGAIPTIGQTSSSTRCTIANIWSSRSAVLKGARALGILVAASCQLSQAHPTLTRENSMPVERWTAPAFLEAIQALIQRPDPFEPSTYQPILQLQFSGQESRSDGRVTKHLTWRSEPGGNSTTAGYHQLIRRREGTSEFQVEIIDIRIGDMPWCLNFVLIQSIFGSDFTVPIIAFGQGQQFGHGVQNPFSVIYKVGFDRKIALRFSEIQPCATRVSLYTVTGGK
jgi:hypothetical protein